MKKKTVVVSLLVVLLLTITVVVYCRGFSIYLARAYSSEPQVGNKVVPAKQAGSEDNHGHFHFTRNGKFTYEGLTKVETKEDPEGYSSYQYMKGTYRKRGKRLIVLNVAWYGMYYQKYHLKDDKYSHRPDNKHNEYYKIYMRLNKDGRVISIYDRYANQSSGGALHEPGKFVVGGIIKDPISLYKSATDNQ